MAPASLDSLALVRGQIVPSRDLGSAELWERSLARSRHRRAIRELGQRARRRKKSISVAMSAALAGGTVFPPAIAAASGGSGSITSTDTIGSGSATTSALRVVLESGSEGPLVAAAQRRLNELLPFSHLAVDGIFGPLTRGAVVEYQLRHQLAATGEIDARMWATMFNAPVLVLGDADSAASSAAVGGGTASGASGGSQSGRGSSNRGGARSGHGATNGSGTQSQFVSETTVHERSGTAHSTLSAQTRATGTGATQRADGGTASSPNEGTGGLGLTHKAPATKPTITAVVPTSPVTRGGGTGATGGTQTQSSTYVLSDGVALPLPRQYIVNGSVDQGVDYSAPGGTPEYAMGSGVIIGEGISGFGPNAPVLKITSGPLSGLEVYYGHAGPDLVKIGQHVTAGQQISEVGYGIVGISTGPHLEIGFYPPGPMGSGSRMLGVIDSLLKEHPTGRAWGTSTTIRAAGDTSRRTRRWRARRTTRAQATGSGGAALPVSVSSASSSSPGVAARGAQSTASANVPASTSTSASASTSSAPATSQAPASSSAPAGPAPATSSAAPVPSGASTAAPSTSQPVAAQPAAAQPTPVATQPAQPAAPAASATTATSASAAAGTAEPGSTASAGAAVSASTGSTSTPSAPAPATTTSTSAEVSPAAPAPTTAPATASSTPPTTAPAAAGAGAVPDQASAVGSSTTAAPTS